ncbi:MAG: BrnA antitoxin family protein [Sphingomonadaceae bacterium]|nr:BrnA antitoxin family protein [Sphingomonadaceae bacterium]
MNEDWDDNPEWTEADFARTRPTSEVAGADVAALLTRRPGRPRLRPEAVKQAISLRLSPDLLTAMRATGRGWQTRAEALLRREFLSSRS